MNKRVIAFMFVCLCALVFVDGAPIKEPFQVTVEDVKNNISSPELAWVPALIKGRIRAGIELNRFMMYAERPNVYEMKKLKIDAQKNPTAPKKKFQPLSQYILGSIGKMGNTLSFTYRIKDLRTGMMLAAGEKSIEYTEDAKKIEKWADDITADIIGQFVKGELAGEAPNQTKEIKLQNKIEALEIEINEYRRYIKAHAPQKGQTLKKVPSGKKSLRDMLK